jgi:thiosulfate/3-mercaptopyruvate sulfurtransferase
MGTTLVGVEELASHLGDPGWIVCDCRHDLADYESGRRAYNEAHIPGARFVHLDLDLSGPKTGLNGRHPLPHALGFGLRLGALGIDDDKQVVAYDASGGPYAARLWWMLRWVGHTAVAVLDGGWEAWLRAGHPVTSEKTVIQPTMYTLRPRPEMTVDVSHISAHLKDQRVQVIDARSPDRFRGQNETLDPVAGHIPGAVNRFFKSNLNEDGSFKDPLALQQAFRDLLGGGREPSSVIHQCGSGVTACHNLLAMEHAGLAGSRLYPGSWSEWVSDRSRPVER